MDPDSIALDLLRRARLDHGEPVRLVDLSHALGLLLIPTAPRGAHGSTDGRAILYDGSRGALVHELAHVACARAGLPEPHDERFVAAVAVRLLVPGQAYRRALRAGLDRAALAEAFRVRETCVALRAGEVTSEPIAIVTPTHVHARGDWPWPAEDVLRRMVRDRVRWLRVEQLGDDRRRVCVRVAG